MEYLQSEIKIGLSDEYSRYSSYYIEIDLPFYCWYPVCILLYCWYSICIALVIFLDILCTTNYRFQTSTPFSEVYIRRMICNAIGWIFWDVGLKNFVSFSFCSSLKYWINLFASLACAFKNVAETLLIVNFSAKIGVLKETSRKWMYFTSCMWITVCHLQIRKSVTTCRFLQDFFYKYPSIFNGRKVADILLV